MNLPNHGDKLIYTPIGAEFLFVAPSTDDDTVWIVESCATRELWRVFATDVKPVPKTIEFWVNVHDGERTGGSTYNSEAAAKHVADLYFPTVQITQHKVTIQL
jgi:hypothetical protein